MKKKKKSFFLTGLDLILHHRYAQSSHLNGESLSRTNKRKFSFRLWDGIENNFYNSNDYFTFIHEKIVEF